MKLIVVGGHSRNIGKTSVMAGLIRGLPSLGWTAVKITQYGHGICSQDGQPCGCEPTEHPFELTEETDPHGRADTRRFLAAGARRSLWLRVREGQLGMAFPGLIEAVRRDDYVIMESNRVLGFLEPDLYLVVLDSSRPDFKSSAREYLARADALVPISPLFDAAAWPDVEPEAFRNKPMFPVLAGRYFSPALCDFVRTKLALTNS
jgi:hypothetical protein